MRHSAAVRGRVASRRRNAASSVSPACASRAETEAAGPDGAGDSAVAARRRSPAASCSTGTAAGRGLSRRAAGATASWTWASSGAGASFDSAASVSVVSRTGGAAEPATAGAFAVAARAAAGAGAAGVGPGPGTLSSRAGRDSSAGAPAGVGGTPERRSVSGVTTERTRTAAAAHAQWRTVADQLRPKVPKLATLMDATEEDVLAYMHFVAANDFHDVLTDERQRTSMLARKIRGERRQRRTPPPGPSGAEDR